METIANAFNIFINTDRGIPLGEDGDALSLPLGQTPIVAGDDEHIRLTLDQFSMRKSWFDINSNNNEVVITKPGGASIVWKMPQGDYDGYEKRFLVDCHTSLAIALNRLYSQGTFTVVPITPEELAEFTINEIIKWKFTMTLEAQNAPPIFQCWTGIGDSYKVLGASRLFGLPLHMETPERNAAPRTQLNADTRQSLDVTPAGNLLTIRGYFKLDLTPETHVYLALDNQMSHNIGTGSLTGGSTVSESDNKSEMTASRILAIIPVDTRHARYVANTERQYFVDLSNRVATDLRLILVDSLGRRFPFIGDNAFQGTHGDRSFKAVIRVDIVKSNKTGTLKTKPPAKSVPPRFSSTMGRVLNLGIPGAGLNVPGQVYGDGYMPLVHK